MEMRNRALFWEIPGNEKEFLASWPDEIFPGQPEKLRAPRHPVQNIRWQALIVLAVAVTDV